MLADLGSHVVDLFKAGHPEEIGPAFAFVENLLNEGLEVERNTAILGFLETVQNVASHRKCGAQAFVQFLGPQSQQAWDELKDVWRGKASLAEVVASERGINLRPRWWQFWRSRSRRSPQDMLSHVENPELRKIIEQVTRE